MCDRTGSLARCCTAYVLLENSVQMQHVLYLFKVRSRSTRFDKDHSCKPWLYFISILVLETQLLTILNAIKVLTQRERIRQENNLPDFKIKSMKRSHWGQIFAEPDSNNYLYTIVLKCSQVKKRVLALWPNLNYVGIRKCSSAASWWRSSFKFSEVSRSHSFKKKKKKSSFIL